MLKHVISLYQTCKSLKHQQVKTNSDVHCLGSEGTGDLESTRLTKSELDSDSTQNAGQFHIQDSQYLRKTSWWLCT